MPFHFVEQGFSGNWNKPFPIIGKGSFLLMEITFSNVRNKPNTISEEKQGIEPLPAMKRLFPNKNLLKKESPMAEKVISD